jgi:hypothetical protein
MNRSRYPNWSALLAGLRANPHQVLAPLQILHECEPEDGKEMFGSGYCWVRAVAGYDEDEHPRAVLPPALFDRLPAGTDDHPDAIAKRYGSVNDAYRALWVACDTYAHADRPGGKT